MIKDPTPIKQFKLMLVGNSGVGKSKVCEVLCSDNQNFNPISKFDENLNSKGTIGVEMHFKTLFINEKLIIKLNLWDFSGKKQFNTIRSEFYSDCNSIIFCFDLCDQNSFSYIETWIKECKKYGGDKSSWVLLGINKENTTSLVSKFDIDKLLISFKMSYYSISLIDKDSIENAFKEIANKLK